MKKSFIFLIISCVIAVTSLAKKTPNAPESRIEFKHYVGELFGGGIVAAVWKESGIEHGLIASLADLSDAKPWSNVTNVLVGSTDQSFLNGRPNTSAIIGQAGHVASAASVCTSFNDGGFKDWYLPSIWELNRLYNSSFEINYILENDNDPLTIGLSYGIYWSSTESDANNAWSQSFLSGDKQANLKTKPFRIRAVRRF